MNAREYWDVRFSENSDHHSRQNTQLSRDIIKQILAEPVIEREVRWKQVVEVGCGTGELTLLIKMMLNPVSMIGSDFSEEAIVQARWLYPTAEYAVFDVIKDDLAARFPKCETVVSSNTLEHFKDPHAVIRNLTANGRRLLAIIPYAQPLSDAYEEEGGAGHAYKFSRSSFLPYRVLAWSTFVSEGWQYRSKGQRTPKQMIVLLEAK